jgi:hypothetical protein
MKAILVAAGLAVLTIPAWAQSQGDSRPIDPAVAAKIAQSHEIFMLSSLSMESDGPPGNGDAGMVYLRDNTPAEFFNVGPQGTVELRLLDQSHYGKIVWDSNPWFIKGADGKTLNGLLHGDYDKPIAFDDGSPFKGPFYTAGTSIIGCRENISGLVTALNAPDARSRIGPDNFQEIFQQAECSDIPSGIEVKIVSVRGSFANVLVDNGYFFSLPREDVIETDGKSVPDYTPPNHP